MGRMFKDRDRLLREQPKRRGKYLGLFCDYRRAVVISCTLQLLSTIAMMMQGEFSPVNVVLDAAYDEIGDPGIAELQDKLSGKDQFVLNLGQALFSAAALVGAIKFNQTMVRVCQVCRHQFRNGFFILEFHLVIFSL